MTGKKLLVADDSLTIQKVIRLALSNEGYEIQTVSDGNDALQQISLFRPDVVLIDVSLPGKTAVEVKVAVEQQDDLRPVRFVLMSSAFEKVDEPLIARTGFHGRLTKPFDPAHLRQVLSDVLADAPAATPAAPPAARAEPRQAPSIPPRLPPALPSSPARAAGPKAPTARAQAPETPPPLPAFSESDFSETSPDSPPQSAPGSSEPPGEPGGMEKWMTGDLPPPLPPLPGDLPTELPPQPPRAEAAPDSSDSSSDLWEKELGLELPPMPGGLPDLPPELPSQAGANDPDSDIKHLTESTIRMSGLDDFQWSVNEPSLRPPAGLAETTGATFPLTEPPAGLNLSEAPQASSEPLISQPIFEPLGETTESLELSSPFGEAGTFTSAPPKAPPSRPGAATPPPPFSATSATPAAAPAPAGITREEIEKLIEAQVHKAVEESLAKFARKMIPEVAERVIKEEIHKMLSELP